MKATKIVSILLALVLMFSLAGCQQAPVEETAPTANPETTAPAADAAVPAADSEEEYVFVTALSNLEYFQTHEQAVEDAAAALGVKGYMIGSDKYDVQEMLNVFDTLIQKGVDGIITPGHFPDAYREVFQKAWDAGIPVCTVTMSVEDSKQLCTFGTNYVEYGRLMAQTLMEKMGGKGQFLVSQNLIGGGQPASDIVEGIKQVAAENPGFELVSVLQDDSDAAVATSVISAALMANPDVKGIIGCQSVSGVGAATAVREAGLSGKIDIVCIDADAPTIEAIENGEIYATVVGKQYTEVYLATQFLYMYNHDMLKLTNDNQAAGISAMPTFVDTGAIIVTKDNAQYFKK